VQDYLKVLIPSAVGLATSIVGAFFSARWAVRRAFQEKWWERKEHAYTEIIEALHDLIRYSELCKEESEEYPSCAQEHPKKAEFVEQYSDAFWKIKKMTDIGAFVISDEAALILQNLGKKPSLEWDKNPPWEIYEADCTYYREALAGIRKCAKKDLKI
jgi:hypothetical protein